MPLPQTWNLPNVSHKQDSQFRFRFYLIKHVNRDIFGKTLRMEDVMSPKMFNANYARAETKSHQNWLLSGSPRGGARPGGQGESLADAARRDSIWAFQRVYSGYYSEVGTMAPWEQTPLSLKLSYNIELVIGILSECIENTSCPVFSHPVLIFM